MTEQVRHQMEATLKKHYGVNLDNSWNRKVTESWDKAQTLVRRRFCCYVFAAILLEVKMQYISILNFLKFIMIVTVVQSTAVNQ